MKTHKGPNEENSSQEDNFRPFGRSDNRGEWRMENGESSSATCRPDIESADQEDQAGQIEVPGSRRTAVLSKGAQRKETAEQCHEEKSDAPTQPPGGY